jgi:hypothetical protein
MGQADPLAARCSVKGCHEQEIFILLAPCGMRIGFSKKSCPREEKGRKGKNEKNRGPDFPFLPFLPSVGKTDNQSINVERTLGSDIAGVRMHPSNGADENSPDDVKKFECTTLLPSSKVAILTPILVTDSAVIYWLPKVNDERVEIFQQIRDVINPIQAMKTSTIPLNEFTENDRLILGAFPHLFLLGVPGNHSLTHDLYSHYMNQFTGAMARESQFFFLSN